MIGSVYMDPDGIWKVVSIDGDEVTVRQIQRGNTNYEREFVVPYEEAQHYVYGNGVFTSAGPQ